MTTAITKKSSLTWVGMVLAVAIMLYSCQPKPAADGLADTLKTGTIHISVDESFKPVMEEQIKTFEGSNPGAKIIAHYKTEADCLKDILRDSATRMVIVTRGLTTREERYFKDSLAFYPRWDELAADAITLVVNNKNKDTAFTQERLQDLLSGTDPGGLRVIFDGLNATSTVRYAMDSILRGKQFDTSVVMAVNGSQQVLEYVANNENAVGLVGISWIGNPEIKAQAEMLKRIKIVALKCRNCADSQYVMPSQYTILTRQYPLVRGLYYILKENYAGLGSGFLNFLQYERGQLIFKRAYLGSSKMGFGIRNIQINETLQKE